MIDVQPGNPHFAPSVPGPGPGARASCCCQGPDSHVSTLHKRLSLGADLSEAIVCMAASSTVRIERRTVPTHVPDALGNAGTAHQQLLTLWGSRSNTQHRP